MENKTKAHPHVAKRIIIANRPIRILALPVLLIYASILGFRMSAPVRVMQKKYTAYCHGTIPDSTNITATDELVNRIMVAVVAVETEA